MSDFSKAQAALDGHPTAKVAHVNEHGEWHFSTPPKDFIVSTVLTKSQPKNEAEPDSNKGIAGEKEPRKGKK